MSSLMNWNTTAASNNEAAPDGAPENMAPSGVNDVIRELMARVKEMQAALPWIDYGKGSGTVTYSMTLSNVFEVEGSDVTGQYVKGRRIKAVGTATGTIYGTISTSTFTANTKVYVDWDSGFLNSETLSIQLGLSPVGLPEPRGHGSLQRSGFRNWAINGNFDIWQRGETITSTLLTGSAFIADKWYVQATSVTISMGQGSFTIGQTVVPNHPKFNCVIDAGPASAANHVVTFNQVIEDVTNLAGKDIVISWWGKADASRNISIEVRQFYGDGGGTAVETALGLKTLGADWGYHWITGKVPDISLGTTICYTNYSLLTFFLNDGGNFASRSSSLDADAKTVHFSEIQVEEGTRPTPFEKRPYGVELDMCHRYYWKDAFPSAAIGAGQAYNTSQAFGFIVWLPAKMWIQPTVTTAGSFVLTDDDGETHPVSSLSVGYQTKRSFGFSEAVISGTASLLAGRSTLLIGAADATLEATTNH